MWIRRPLIWALPLLFLGAPALAQDDRPQQPAGETLPMKPAREIRFTTDEGTWMSLDLSPAGDRIVFDLLGDLYSLAPKGGSAKRLTRGLAFDTQPTFSPDGRLIAFVSDRSGADNLWIVRADGSAPRQLSFGDDDTVLASPAWSADGRALYVSRYRPSLNNYELWRYDIDGKKSLLAPIRTGGDSSDTRRSTLGVVASPDGRYLYFARRTGGLDFETVDSWTIVRRELTSGAETEILKEVDARRREAKGSYFRPTVSRDGRLLAYATRLRNQTELRVRDLATGSDRRLAFPIEHDVLQASMWQDIVPRFAFTPDSRAVLLSRGGGFERIDVATGQATRIPFTADVRLAVGPRTKADIREESGPVRARLIQSPVASPDGRTIVFSALTRLYRAELGGEPVALETGTEPAFQPSWSLDGRTIAFVTWSSRNGGAVWTMPADGSAAPSRRSDLPAFYSYPVFAPDGRSIIAVRSAAAARNRISFEVGKLRDAELVEIPLPGGPARAIARGRFGSRPHFRTARPGHVVLLSDEGLVEIDRATGARTPIALVKGPGWYFQDGPVAVDDARLSPDGKWILAQVAQQLHLVATPEGDERTIELESPGRPHRRLTDVGADFFEWSADGRTIHWSVGSTFRTLPLTAAESMLNPAAAPDWRAAPQAAVSDYEMRIEAARAGGRGTLLLRGARVLTMGKQGAIEAADILVEGDRIAAVGPVGSLRVPVGAAVRDVAGKTIVPGFIDAHDHIGGVRREVLGLDDWTLQARLAYGVTTSFDPSTLSIDMMPYQDLIDAGMMVGPRLRSSGPAIFSMNRFSSSEEVRAVLRRYRDHYRLQNVKQYRSGNRRVRQWIAQEARALGLQPTVEGALSLKLDLTQIIDGYAGHEHALPVALRKDVMTLLKEMGTSYTTTLQITNGGAPAQDWFVATRDPAGDARLRRFWPPFLIDSKLSVRPWQRLEEYRWPAIAADAARVQRSGGTVGMGAHGDLPGIGYHFELEAHVLGGMTPSEALRAGTIGSARAIGREGDLGSIEVGKRADLVVLDRDPQSDIKAAREIAFVMKDGRLFDGATLDEIWPDRRPLERFWPDEAGPQQWLPETPNPLSYSHKE